MENATKALLIAAAVLIAILIISLGLVVYNMASESIDSVNFSGQEIKAFNDQFEQYRGDRVRGSEVNALLKTALQANMQSRSEGLEAKAGQKYVEVTLKNKSGSATATALSAAATSLGSTKADTSKTYTVTIDYDSTTGFAKTIAASANN